jgi:hypothetical protein
MHKQYLEIKVPLESSTMMVKSKWPTTWIVVILPSAQRWDWKNWNDGVRTKILEVKIIEVYELEQFKGWERRTLEIWSRQTTKKPRKINVSNECVF